MSEPGNTDLYALGWDVRGWMGQQQAVAIARLPAGGTRVEWIGVSPHFRFHEGARPGLEHLAEPALGTAGARTLASKGRLVVAIDAPLAFPVTLLECLTGDRPYPTVPARAIDNPLAFRACERWVAEHYYPTPFSAPFDKLGNNATLAMAVSNRLAEQGLVRIPQDGAAEAGRAIIEVYPALAKEPRKGKPPATKAFTRHLPPELDPARDTDRYDAAICALLGLVFSGAGPRLGCPPLTRPGPGNDPREGWIYAPMP